MHLVGFGAQAFQVDPVKDSTGIEWSGLYQLISAWYHIGASLGMKEQYFSESLVLGLDAFFTE